MKNIINISCLAVVFAPAISPAVTIFQLAPQNPDLVITTDPSVTSSSAAFDDGAGFTGDDRYFYTTPDFTTFSESLEFSSTTSEFQLTVVTWDFIQFFSTATDYVSVELVVNGASVGSATTEGAPDATFNTLSWDVSGVAPGNDFDLLFNVSEVGGAVGFFELADPEGFNGLVVDGTITAIPEPSSLLLLGLGSLGVAVRRRRR